jgi:hypothetical protein
VYSISLSSINDYHLLRVMFWGFPQHVFLIADVSEICVCSNFIGCVEMSEIRKLVVEVYTVRPSPSCGRGGGVWR